MDLLRFISNNASVGSPSGNLEKVAEEIVEQEEMLFKTADQAVGEGSFIGRGAARHFMKLAVAAVTGAEMSGMNDNNPPSAAQSPLGGGIELPSDAPGPNDVLSTVKPSDGKQYNNTLFQKHLDQKRMQAGLARANTSGVSELSGADHGTAAQFTVKHT